MNSIIVVTLILTLIVLTLVTVNQLTDRLDRVRGDVDKLVYDAGVVGNRLEYLEMKPKILELEKLLKSKHYMRGSNLIFYSKVIEIHIDLYDIDKELDKYKILLGKNK